MCVLKKTKNYENMTNSAAPDQRALLGDLCSGSTLFSKVYKLISSTVRVKKFLSYFMNKANVCSNRFKVTKQYKISKLGS